MIQGQRKVMPATTTTTTTLGVPLVFALFVQLWPCYGLIMKGESENNLPGNYEIAVRVHC